MTEQTWEEFVKENQLDVSGFNLFKENAYIKKVGKEWCVFSESGKRMGCYNSRKAAEKRLKQIEYFKHKKGNQELAGYECYCPECGSYFYSNKRCDLSICPSCKDSNMDNIEVIGEF